MNHGCVHSFRLLIGSIGLAWPLVDWIGDSAAWLVVFILLRRAVAACAKLAWLGWSGGVQQLTGLADSAGRLRYLNLVLGWREQQLRSFLRCMPLGAEMARLGCGGLAFGWLLPGGAG